MLTTQVSLLELDLDYPPYLNYSTLPCQLHGNGIFDFDLR